MKSGSRQTRSSAYIRALSGNPITVEMPDGRRADIVPVDFFGKTREITVEVYNSFQLIPHSRKRSVGVMDREELEIYLNQPDVRVVE